MEWESLVRDGSLKIHVSHGAESREQIRQSMAGEFTLVDHTALLTFPHPVPPILILFFARLPLLPRPSHPAVRHLPAGTPRTTLSQEPHTPLILALGRQRQADLYEFETSLVYKASSRIARATQRNSVSKNKTKTKPDLIFLTFG